MRFTSATRPSTATTCRSPRIIDEHVRETMQDILERDPGRLVRRPWIAENESGRPSSSGCARRPRPPSSGSAPAPRPDALPQPGRGRPARLRRAATAPGPSPMSARGPAHGGPSSAGGSVRIFDTTLRDGEQAPGAGLTAPRSSRSRGSSRGSRSTSSRPASRPPRPATSRRSADRPGDPRTSPSPRSRAARTATRRRSRPSRSPSRPHIHVFIATSDIHLKHKLRIDRDDGLAEAVRWVRHGASSSAATPRSSSAPRTPRDRGRLPAARSTRPSSRRAPRPSTSPTPSAMRSRPSSARSCARSSTWSAIGRPSASTATTTSAWPRPTRSRPSRRRAPGRGHDQRPRRARRQRVARRGGHGAAHAPDAVPATSRTGVATEQITARAGW